MPRLFQSTFYQNTQLYLRLWKVCSLFFLPVLIARLAWLSLHNRAYRHKFWNRFGIFPDFRSHFWIHGVSLGEAKVACQLLDGLCNVAHGIRDAKIVLSCTTPAGYEVFTAWQQQHPSVTSRVVYMPFDIPFAVNLALGKIQPQVFVSIETELWPIFLDTCYKKNVVCIVANARLSASSARSLSKVRCLFKQSFPHIVPLCQDYATARRYTTLGSAKPLVLGNIKFDNTPKVHTEIVRVLQTYMTDSNQIITIGSSRRDEIAFFATSCVEMLGRLPQTQVLWVPRHPHDCKIIRQTLQKHHCSVTTLTMDNLRFQSTDNHIDISANTPQVILIEGFGVLVNCYQLADIVILGGSFGKGGSQNVIEPCALGKCVVCGPSRHNFAAVHRQLKRTKAAVYVDDITQLPNQVVTLLSSNVRMQIAKNAKKFLIQQPPITHEYVQFLVSVFAKLPKKSS